MWIVSCVSSCKGANIATTYQSGEEECQVLDFHTYIITTNNQPRTVLICSVDSLHEYLSMPENITWNLTVKASALSYAQF